MLEFLQVKSTLYFKGYSYYDYNLIVVNTELISYLPNHIFIEFVVGTKHRFRRVLRDSPKPQGQCYSKLNESISCYADACFTYTQTIQHDKNGFRRIQCIRLDGVIVEGKRLFCMICVVPLFPFRL